VPILVNNDMQKFIFYWINWSIVTNLYLYLDTRPETSSPFVDYLIDSGLLQTRPDLDLLQLIHIFHWLLMLYTAPNAVVDRLEVGAVGHPEVRRDERWCHHDAETQPSHVPDEWRRCFWACVRVKGQQFEHLWQLLSMMSLINRFKFFWRHNV